MKKRRRALVALGSNLGDRKNHLEYATRALHDLPEVYDLIVSRFRETPPVSPVPQGPYLNAAASLETTLLPRELLVALQNIEQQRGRDRSREQRHGPRTLDLDLLLYADWIIDEKGLTVPHPRMHERAFVLEPLVEIAPGAMHPILGLTVRELLHRIRIPQPELH